jgi:polyketide biosynthesis enoyl-CoA hydratase PksH
VAHLSQPAVDFYLRNRPGARASKELVMHTHTLSSVHVENHVAIITLTAGATGNLLSRQLMEEILGAVTRVETMPDIVALAIKGADGVFSHGMDVREAAQALENGPKAELNIASAKLCFTLFRKLKESSKPIISLVDGTVKGGGIGLIAASDLVIASRQSTFQLPEGRLGLIPACVTPFLARRIGIHATVKMTLLMENVSSDEALRVGIVDSLADDLNEGLRKVIMRLNALAPVTVQRIKEYSLRIDPISHEIENLATTTLANSLDQNFFMRIKHLK